MVVRSAAGKPVAAAVSTGELLAAGAARVVGASDSPRLDAEVLLSFVTQRPRSSLLAFPERVVAREDAARYDSLIARRAAGEPVAYLCGTREFFSLELGVTRDVLIPRDDTEVLVAAALEQIAAVSLPKVLDVGTGSGAIAIAIKHARPDAEVHALDVSAAALAVARTNAQRHRLDVRFVESHWLAALEGERFDAIVCNPPYIRSDDPALSALQFEPQQALAGGSDGLDAFRAVLLQAAAHLAPRGVLLFEHGFDQRQAVAQLARAHAFGVVRAHDDLAGHARVLVLAPGAASGAAA